MSGRNALVDLSIIIPTVHPGKWLDIYNSIEDSVEPFTWEVIFVGPCVAKIPSLPNIKTITEFGCPSRCVQIASLIASGRYITWGSDDGTYQPGALTECIELLDNAEYGKNWGDWGYNAHDEVIVRYIEGLNNDPTLFEDGDKNPHYKGPHPEAKLGYWHAHFHDDLRLPGIDLSTRVAPLGMLATERFKSLGGFDCRMQHINMSCIDLSLRLQKDNGQLLVSPSFVMKCDFDPNNHRVWDVMKENDGPLFKSLYQDNSRMAKIKFNNWVEASPVWERRWEVKKI